MQIEIEITVAHHREHTVNTPISPPPVASLVDHGPEVGQEEGTYSSIYGIIFLLQIRCQLQVQDVMSCRVPYL